MILMKISRKVILNKIAAVKKTSGKFLTLRYLLAAAAVLITILFLWQNKSLLVVAMVNGRPVLRTDLEKRLIGRFADQTLEELVGEALIRQEAGKRGIGVTPAEVDAKIAEIEKTLEGKVSLGEALSQQGMTMDDLKRQLELQLLMEKMNADKLAVTDGEVDEYLEKNKQTMIATEAAAKREEARKALMSEKRSEVLGQFFTGLRSQAKIIKFL